MEADEKSKMAASSAAEKSKMEADEKAKMAAEEKAKATPAAKAGPANVSDLGGAKQFKLVSGWFRGAEAKYYDFGMNTPLAASGGGL